VHTRASTTVLLSSRNDGDTATTTILLEPDVEDRRVV
jgi:hypothetical protein